MSDTETGVVDGLRRSFAGHTWERITLGCSGADVFAVHRGPQVVAYAKQGEGPVGMEIEAEADRVTWLEGRVPSPRLRARGVDGAWSWMACSVVLGVPACEPHEHEHEHEHEREREALATIVDRLAEVLRQLHALPIDDCPFDARLDALMDQTRQRVARGWVDETDFDPERQGWTASEVLAEVERTLPRANEWVLTHGDACLPNVLLDGSRLGGWIDLGRLGVGDRHRDLALMARSTDHNLGEGWGRRLLAQYGGTIDESRLRFYRLLDELW